MSKPHSRLKRTRRRWGNVLLVFVIIVLAVCLAVQLFLEEPEQKQPGLPVQSLPVSTGQPSEGDQAAQDALRSHYERKEKFYTILLSGVDDGNGGSDTNILVAVDADAGYVYGVSIPRDSKAVINGKNRKINAAYNIGGMELLAETVTEQLGIPVDYTVLVNLRGFEALINAIGGVDFYVPLNMDYDDPTQNLSIHLSKGMQHLNGENALKVVRFRHNNDGSGYGTEDVGRMSTQQDFLRAVAKKTLTLSNLDKLDDFVKIFQSYVETDLTLGNLAWLGTQLINMGADKIDFTTLPGVWQDYYIYVDAEETLTLVNQFLNPYVEDRVPGDLNIPT